MMFEGIEDKIDLLMVDGCECGRPASGLRGDSDD